MVPLLRKGIFEIGSRQSNSNDQVEEDNEQRLSRISSFSKSSSEKELDNYQVASTTSRPERPPKSKAAMEGGGAKEKLPPSDIDQMKERFAKLLLGEDMSGGGKGVSSALALSNAITNLAASVFAEQTKLEPMPDDRKARWRKETDWLLSVTDHIVEFVASKQESKDGSPMEIMVTRQRKDLHVNIPALRKLDAMLLGYLDNFRDQKEFWYASKDAVTDAEKERRGEKWWLPKPRVPPQGLSDGSRKWLQFQKESVQQVHKLAMAINAQVIAEMAIPDAYIESLPKNGKTSLGDAIYKSITVDYFNPLDFLGSMDLSTEHKIVDLKNRIEASIIIWQRKVHNKDGRSSWGSTVSLEKREQFEERAEMILLLLKQRYPGISQSALDISKIQYNKDVGHAIIESYSRILETLAFAVVSKIDDVLYADSLTNPSSGDPNNKNGVTCLNISLPRKLNQEEELDMLEAIDARSNSMTLSDFMGWGEEEKETEDHKESYGDIKDVMMSPGHNKMFSKPAKINTDKKFSYIDKLGDLGGLRSPISRH